MQLQVLSQHQGARALGHPEAWAGQQRTGGPGGRRGPGRWRQQKLRRSATWWQKGGKLNPPPPPNRKSRKRETSVLGKDTPKTASSTSQKRKRTTKDNPGKAGRPNKGCASRL
eukprot:5900504-Amphidinium_carterae.1